MAVSLVDGFALRAADLVCANELTPVPLDIIDVIGEGEASDLPVLATKTIRVAAGSIIPEKADTVVSVDEAVITGDGGIGQTASFSKIYRMGSNVQK